MSVRDCWPFSRYEGRVRIETGPYSETERQQLRKGGPVVVVGFLVLGISQDWWLAVFAMMITSVFANIYFE